MKFFQKIKRFIDYVKRFDQPPKVVVIREGETYNEEYFYDCVVIVEAQEEATVTNCVFEYCTLAHIDNGILKDGLTKYQNILNDVSYYKK